MGGCILIRTDNIGWYSMGIICVFTSGVVVGNQSNKITHTVFSIVHYNYVISNQITIHKMFCRSNIRDDMQRDQLVSVIDYPPLP